MLTRIRPPIPNRPTGSALQRLFSHQVCYYSFESGRKPKSGGTLKPNSHQVSPAVKDDLDSKPIVISGRGRRASHRAALSNPSKQNAPIPRLTLPFKPLSSNHLAHLKPTTLFVDLFFSLDRPLLEIELGLSERRSITSETKQSKLELEPDPELSFSQDDQDDDYYPHISSGSPSDPAFKPPHPSSARLPSDENELEDEPWSTTDPYSAYLITEPEGVHPAWTKDLKRCLATSQAFIPPSPPKVEEFDLSLNRLSSSTAKNDSGGHKCQETALTEKEIKLDRERQRTLKFLAPYGLASSKSNITQDAPNQESAGSSGNEENNLPGISQDPLSLTMQAARFLHSGMMANRWPEAATWASVESQLRAAMQSFNKSDDSTLSQVEKNADSFPPIRGQERSINSGRRNRVNTLRHFINIQGESGPGQTYSFNADQLGEIIKYSQKIIQGKIGVESIPKSILRNLERFGQFLIQKHFKGLNAQNPQVQTSFRLEQPGSTPIASIPIVIVDESSVKIDDQVTDDGGVQLDSVFRKKKRKMKVHKYKKRRKARRTLRKRQGKA